MGSQYNINVKFLQGNISPGPPFQANDVTNFPFLATENVMLPSPENEAKELNAYVSLRNSQQPLQTQQGDTPMLYPTQMPVNFIKQEISIYHQNEYKPECFGNHDEFGMVVISEGMENLTQKSHSSFTYPPTPTTPINENFVPEGFPITPPAEINMFNPATFITLYQQQETFYELGYYFLHVAKPCNPYLAFSHFATAASLGSQRGKHQFAYCFQHGIGVNKDEERAVKIYLEIANVDPPNAATLCQLGICFQMGIGIEADTFRAVQYYERAVLMGHTDAMFNLAYCLRYGLGTPVDYKRAYELYYRLAELGDPQGMKLLGNCKLSGIGTVKDENGALEWFRRSSESDIYWGGKMQYALHLLEGINTIPNHIEAFNLIRTVCENFPLCPGPNKLLLGRFYHVGIGCQIDLEKALYWYERALRSYYMPLCSVQECEMFINDIRNQQFQSSTMMFDVGN